MNPLAYINRNVRIDGVLALSDEVAQKAEELEGRSNEFHKKAERLNSCCHF